MFVTAEDFNTPPFDIPNLDNVVNTFPDFVTEREDAELSGVFGVLFWDAFKAGVNALPDDWDTDSSYEVDDQVVYGSKIYKALLNNSAITPGTDPLTWEEQAANRWLLLKVGANYSYIDRTYKWVGMQVAIKPMIYSLWLRDVLDNSVTGAGNVKAKTENSNVIGSSVRVVKGWNEYVDKLSDNENGNIFGYLYVNQDDFADIVPLYNDLYTYMLQEMQNPKRQNVFDL